MRFSILAVTALGLLGAPLSGCVMYSHDAGIERSDISWLTVGASRKDIEAEAEPAEKSEIVGAYRLVWYGYNKGRKFCRQKGPEPGEVTCSTGVRVADYVWIFAPRYLDVYGRQRGTLAVVYDSYDTVVRFRIDPTEDQMVKLKRSLKSRASHP